MKLMQDFSSISGVKQRFNELRINMATITKRLLLNIWAINITLSKQDTKNVGRTFFKDPLIANLTRCEIIRIW